MRKKLISSILVALMAMATMSLSVFATNDTFDKTDCIITPAKENANVSTYAAVTRASCPNYATSTEILQLRYNGYIQFQPSYPTGSNDGSGLRANSRVKQGSIDYQRSGSSVSDQGRQYTTLASSTADTAIYSASVSAWDDLLYWSSGATTSFYRWWTYF